MPDYFIYCRKSEEDEDRQVLSIESQTIELKRLAETRGLRVREILTEARSAKEPGRPVFGKLMERIGRGDAKGVICWKLDRLARNPIDGGSVIWAIKKGLEIVTPTQTFRQADDTAILTYIEFGMAQKYIDDLSRNVKRGLRTKAERGWYPTLAPLGYLNVKNGEKGMGEIVPDPERFALVRRMWDLMLSGAYTIPQIVDIADKEWGFRTRLMKKLGGKPICASRVHRMFTHPIYYGWFEYPRGSGQWHRGNHKPMVTEEEFDRVQLLLGRKGKPRPAKHAFPFTALIRCGECGGMVTAEEKHQLICGVCKTKFAYRNRQNCPNCKASIADMPTRTFLHYEYYHCIKRGRPRCGQGSIHASELERQIAQFLTRLRVSERTLRWAKQSLEEFRIQRHGHLEEARQSAQRAYEACLKQLDNLLALKTSDRNVDGRLLSDEEYERRRSVLLTERAKLERAIREGPDPETLIRRIESTMTLAYRAQEEFQKGDVVAKRRVLAAIGSNLTLKDRKLNIDAKIPFRIIGNELAPMGSELGPIEPEKNAMIPMESGRAVEMNPALRARQDDVRTLKRKVDGIMRKLYRYFLEHPKEPATTFDLPPEKFPWQEAA
jgi:site-specific DNA recombinase